MSMLSNAETAKPGGGAVAGVSASMVMSHPLSVPILIVGRLYIVNASLVAGIGPIVPTTTVPRRNVGSQLMRTPFSVFTA